jgi:hypothetical protein
MTETTLRDVRPWPCEAICDAPECAGQVGFALNFDNPETPGLGTLYLCGFHTRETVRRYDAKAGAEA